VSDINWSAELRKIEREYDGLPPERSRTQIRLQRVQEIIAKSRFEERLNIVGVRVQLALIGALGTSLFWWPYGHSCGFSLWAFLAAQTVVIVGGLAIAIRTWRDQRVWPFAGSALFIMIAWTVLAVHALPRLGYAPGASLNATWTCHTQR
jgi:hypothetical protein